MSNRNNCATPFEIVDGLKFIQNERKRLEKIVSTKEFAKNRHWQWMLEYLGKTDKEHLAESLRVQNWTANNPEEEYDPAQDYVSEGYVCKICYKPKRYLLSTSFSFCDEYGCGMQICKECGLKIGELANKIPQEGRP